MKRKALFKFYFAADELNGALDRIIAAAALHCGETTAESAAQRIGEIIQVKICLGGLWDYLDGIMCGLTERERLVLKFYGNMRTGIKRLGTERMREIKRVAIKFTRRATRINKFCDGLRLLGKYYCLL